MTISAVTVSQAAVLTMPTLTSTSPSAHWIERCSDVIPGHWCVCLLLFEFDILIPSVVQLHTTAAYYPEHPTAEQRQHAHNFMVSLSHLFPCSYCAADFRDNLDFSPPQTESRAEFSVWVCKQHNIVNQKIGKNVFPCTMENLDKRWRTGDKRCWPALGGEH